MPPDYIVEMILLFPENNTTADIKYVTPIG